MLKNFVKAAVVAISLTKIKCLTLLTLFTISSLSSNVIAQQQPDADFAPEQQKLQWSPGEAYNAINGTMNYKQTDLYLPGNGKLPIVISRRFSQRAIGRSDKIPEPKSGFGYFEFSLPRLYYLTRQNRETRYCKENGSIDDRAVLNGSVVFTYGDTYNIFAGRTGNTILNRDGWKVQCQPYRGAIGYSNPIRAAGTMLVTSPDGIKYELWINGFGVSASANIPSWTTTFVVRKITDPYGNTLTYNYDEPNAFSRARLKSIVASDGRVVTFTYSSNTIGSDFYNRIRFIESNSSVNPVKLSYSYPDNQMIINRNGIASTTIDLSVSRSDIRINKITYPTGGTVNYTYGAVRRTANTPYATLATRRTSDGGTYEFDYRDNGDDTFVRSVKTPSAWLEYTYGEPVKPVTVGIIQNHKLNSGRLINFSRFGLNGANTKGQKLFGVDYAYKNLNPQGNNQLSQVVVPEKITTKMNFPISGDARSVFTKEVTAFDEWGFPRRVVESGPTGTNASSVYTYQSDALSYADAYSSIVIGKVKTVSQGADHDESFTYNTKGDVTSHTVNGVTINYQWHLSGSSRGEMYTESTGPRKVTTYLDYKRGHAQRISNPSGYIKNLVINDNGTIASENRFATNSPSPSNTSQMRTYQYDALRRLNRVDPIRTQTVVKNYQWLNNNLQKVTDENGRRYESFERLDGFGRTIARGTRDIDQNRWSTVQYLHDSEGRLIYESYPRNVSSTTGISSNNIAPGITYRYDALDRVTRVSQSETTGNDTVHTYQYSSNSAGDLTMVERDGRNSSTYNTYVAVGTPHYQYVSRIVQADDTETIISRNAVTGRVFNSIRAGELTRYLYNSKRQLALIDRNENGVTTFSYYDNGLLAGRANNGRQVRYEYFDDDKLSKEIFTDSNSEDITRSYSYDRYQNLASIQTTSQNGTQNNTVQFAYDADDNVISQVLSVDGIQYTVSYAYDELSNLSEITYPNNRRYRLKPNSFGDPTELIQLGGEQKTLYNLIQYNADNTMKLLRRNGHQIKNDLNAGLRPFRYRLEQFGNNRSEPIDERQYFYDKAANVSRINNAISSRYTTFAYDQRNRLTQENFSSNENWSFGYLANDNIDWMRQGSQQSTFEYDSSSSRLIGVRTGGTERRYEYDAQGNMTSHERLTSSTSKASSGLTYNAANQLVASSDGTRYAYDGRGLRVKQDRQGAIHTMYDARQTLIYRHDTQAGVTSEYFYVSGKLVARRDEDVSGESTNNPIVDPTTAPDRPVAVAPSGSGVSQNPSYTWTAVPGATSYIVDVREADSDAVLFYQEYSASQGNCSAGTGNCAVQKADIPMSGSKRWRVRARNAEGLSSWTEFSVFAVGDSAPTTPGEPSSVPGLPIPVSPIGSIETPNPSYTWKATAGATSYILDVREADNTTVLFYQEYSASQGNCANGTGNCAVNKADIPMSGSKSWRVRSKNDTGTSEWTEFSTFTVGGSTPNTPTSEPAVPSPAWPSGSVTTASPIFQWDAINGATSYYLEVQDSSEAVRIWQSYTSAELGCSNNGERCEIQKPDAPMVGANRWRARAVNTVGTSAWSEWRSFNVVN